MPLQTIAYNFASELTGIIRGLVKNFPEKNIRFVIPSKKDKIWRPELEKNVWTWNEIYEDVNRAGNLTRRRVISPPDHLLILRSILQETLANFPEKARELPGLERPGFLSIISDDIRELLNEAVRPENLNHNPESDSPAEFLLPEVYSRYINYLEKNNLIDSAQIWTAALSEIIANQQWGKNFVIVFVGFMSFNGGQIELVRALNDRCEQVIVLKPEANLKNFHDVDEQFRFVVPEKKSAGKILQMPASEPGLEPEIIARTLALWRAGNFEALGNFTSFDDVGIMIDKGRESSFCEAFERYGVPYNLMSGVPISQTLPGKILASIRNLYTRHFPTYDTAILLTQSCFAGVNFPLIKAYRAGYSGLDGWEKYLSDKDEKYFVDALAAIKAIKKFCNALSGKKTPAKIIKAFHEFLTEKNLWLSQDDKIAAFPELDESVRQTASAIQTVGEKYLSLHELITDLGQVLDVHFSTEEAFDFLEDWCKNTNTRPPLQFTNSVRIFAGQPPVLAFFPIWIMTGVTAKTWSEIINSSPLLGNPEREFLNMPTQSEKAAQHEALFRRLLHTGEKISIVSRPQLDDEGRPVSESPFMQRFLNDMPDWTSVQLESEGINIFLGSDGFVFPKIDAGEKISRKIPRIEKKANAVGASDIHELLECPFLWWQKRIAKIYEEESEIFSPAEWGNLLHEFWRRVWTQYREDMNAAGKFFVQIANNEWEKLLLCEEDDYKNFSHILKDFRLKRRLKGVEFRAKRLADVQAKIIDGLHEAGYTHRKILLEDEAHLKNKLDGITFLGQCDRIEILSNPEGEEIAFIADYKDGASEKYEKSTNIENRAWNFDGRKKFERGLQLSVYAALFKNYRLMGTYILGLEDGKIAGTISDEAAGIFDAYKSQKKLHENISERIEEGEYAMKCAVEVLRAGEFLPEYNSGMCKFCRVKSICRKGEFKGEFLREENDADDDE